MKRTLNYLLIGFVFIGIAFISFSDAIAYDATACLNNTKDEGQCKDCCDCMDTDAAGRTSCRDACIAKKGNFSANSDFITVTAPSTLGPNGDYSAALNASTAQECKLYCDGSLTLSCGDRRYCRDKCNAKYSDGNQTNTSGNQPNTSEGSGISIEQAVSDEAQQNTISFDGLAFLTGDLCGDSFLPPGKVADFSGFQYLRDTDPTNMGHNTDFVTIIAFNMLEILSDSQISELVALAKTQISMINEYGYKRFPLMKAFRRLIDGDIPSGTTGLSKTAVMAYSAELYQVDGEISYGRAQALGNILRALTTEQKAKLTALKAKNGVGNWEWDSSQNNPLESLKLDKDVNVAVMTYASEMYSWYAGSVEADTYFCPERQGTYFGSFYMKDGPAMAAGPGFTISSTLTADMGSSFIKLLTTDQSALVTNLVNIQRDDLNAIVETRRAISTELRKFMVTASVDKETVLALAKKYGESDGAIIYNYATNFVGISKTLSSEQKSKLTALRETWNTIPCSGAYLYSEKLAAMPEIMNTDFLFGVAGSATTSSTDTIKAPILTLKKDGTKVTASWNTVSGATGYMLYYAPYPKAEYIGSLDMKTKTSLLVDISNSAYYVAIKSYNGNTFSSYSNIEYFVTTTVVSSATAGTTVKIADGLTFTEGPAADAGGNLYFSDITANKIYKWSTAGQLSTFKTNTGGANGLYFDQQGNLIACEGTNGRLVSIDSKGNVTVLADKYGNKAFNEPNDLWIDPKGGIYFSDPLYIKSTLSQDGEHVYYLTPKRDNLVRVISDMVRPNGLIGTADGKTLYATDYGAGKTYKYSINQDGSLSNKTLFVSAGSDGMTIDSEGNVYLTTKNGVQVYSSIGTLIQTIGVADATNVCFGGADKQTLFITAKTSVYSVKMWVKGLSSLTI